jgi:hypothetical protein
MFYTYDQNNSGGGFDRDDKVACTVIIEAESAKEADVRAEEVGIYFDDDYDIDCACCGTRWSRAWDDGEETPQIYGKDIADHRCMWTPVGFAYAHVYYKDGTKKSFIKEEGS